MKTPLLSIVVLVRDLPQLFALTADSILNQSFKDYEIIVIDRINKEEIFDPYSNDIEHIEVILGDGLGTLMQTGFEKAKGEYVQFLLTGDSFLGTNALESLVPYFQEGIDLVYCNYIKRELNILPYAEKFPFNRKFLTKGILPSKFQSIWIKKEMIEKVGGINANYSYRPNLDLLSKILKQKKIKVKEVNRVVVDCEMRKKPTTDLLRRFIETFQVIHKNFGYVSSLRWILTQDYISLMLGLYSKMKKAFYNP